jgi:hypothetical protein
VYIRLDPLRLEASTCCIRRKESDSKRERAGRRVEGWGLLGGAVLEPSEAALFLPCCCRAWKATGDKPSCNTV